MIEFGVPASYYEEHKHERKKARREIAKMEKELRETEEELANTRIMDHKQTILEAAKLLDGLGPINRVYSKLSTDFKAVIPRRIIEETLYALTRIIGEQ